MTTGPEDPLGALEAIGRRVNGDPEGNFVDTGVFVKGWLVECIDGFGDGRPKGGSVNAIGVTTGPEDPLGPLEAIGTVNGDPEGNLVEDTGVFVTGGFVECIDGFGDGRPKGGSVKAVGVTTGPEDPLGPLEAIGTVNGD